MASKSVMHRKQLSPEAYYGIVYTRYKYIYIFFNFALSSALPTATFKLRVEFSTPHARRTCWDDLFFAGHAWRSLCSAFFSLLLPDVRWNKPMRVPGAGFEPPNQQLDGLDVKPLGPGMKRAVKYYYPVSALVYNEVLASRDALGVKKQHRTGDANVCMCVYASMHVCVLMYERVYGCMCFNIWYQLYVCMYACIIYLYASMFICVYPCMYISQCI